MRVAALIYGSYRTFDYVSKFMDFFKNKLNCDFYFSTWSRSYNQNPPIKEEFTRLITPNLITDNLSVKDYIILNESDFNKNYYNVSDFHFIQSTQERMTFLWKQGLKLIIQSNEKYDMIILIRPDVYYDIKCDVNYFYTLSKKNYIYTLTYGGVDFRENINNPKNWDYYTNDLMFVGSYETIHKFISTFPDKEINGVHWDPAFHILSLGINPEHIENISTICVRLNILREDINNVSVNTFEKYRNKF